MNKTAALHNLGCKVNAYETEAMRQMLEDAGYQIVPFAPGADVYVINTCSVTNIADRKSRQMLHKARKMNPDAIVVATGCYVQTAEEPVEKDAAIDIVLGNNKKKDLIEAIRQFEAQRVTCSQIIDINHTKEYESLPVSGSEEHTRAHIKVQDGCNQFCTYCIIPYARGRVRSREMEDVLKEARVLAEHGFKEVVLTGIHLSSYGVDKDTTLLALIEAVHEIDGIERIRLGSLEPGIITREFAEKLASMSKICPHFHLSLQSGCSTVLKRMNRRYTAEEFEEKCRILRETFENPAITTDVIVGFPGETEEEFETTVDFLTRIRLYETHIFKYSRRHGTKAAVMPNQITESVKGVRSDRLLELNEKNSSCFEEQLAGKEVEALMEECQMIQGKEYFVGHTKEYIKIAVPANQDYTNQILKGKIGEKLAEHVCLLKEFEN